MTYAAKQAIPETVYQNSSVAPRENKRHSPFFLALFTVFLITTAVSIAIVAVGVLRARPIEHDTIWFWASGRLFVHGANPYDTRAIHRIAIALGWNPARETLMMPNPPSALFLTAPFGLMNAPSAVIAWSLMLTAFLVLSVRLIARIVERNKPEYLLLALVFPSVLGCIEVGQTGLITLLGLALFLWLHKEWPFWAGVALSLCAFKPHLFLIFGVVLLAWIAREKKWLILAGAGVAVAMEMAIAMAVDPLVWSHYRAGMAAQPFTAEHTPTFGGMIRMAIAPGELWLEFIPVAFACGWAVWYFLRNRSAWNWATHGSVATLVSLSAAPYSWFTDQVIAIPAILFALNGPFKARQGSIALLLIIMIAKEVQVFVTGTSFVMIDGAFAVALLGWYLYATFHEFRSADV